MLTNKKQQTAKQQASAQNTSSSPETSPQVELALDHAHIQYQKSRTLHIYVWGAVGIWILFVASFAHAFWRVSQSEKFTRQPLMHQPLNSISWSENQKAHLTYPEPKKK
ncbi:MAG: hypothetical protein ACRC06_03215 [Waterburya sp.]